MRDKFKKIIQGRDQTHQREKIVNLLEWGEQLSRSRDGNWEADARSYIADYPPKVTTRGNRLQYYPTSWTEACRSTSQAGGGRGKTTFLLETKPHTLEYGGKKKREYWKSR